MFATVMKRIARMLVLAAALTITVSPALAASTSAPQEEFPVPAGFVPAFRAVDGVNLHYLKGGTGPLVLLVHGFGQS